VKRGFVLAWLMLVGGLFLGPSAAAADVWRQLVDGADAACARADYLRAEALLLDALDALAHVPASDPRIRDTEYQLARVYEVQGDGEHAEVAYLNAIGEGQAILAGLADANTLIRYVNGLAVLYEKMGDLERAEERRQQVVNVAVFASLSPSAVAITTGNLARLQRRRGRPNRAFDTHLEALALLEVVEGPPHLIAQQLEALAGLHVGAGRDEEAEAAYLEAIEIWQVLGRPATFVSAKTFAGYSALLEHRGRYTEADAYFAWALDLGEEVWGRSSGGGRVDGYVAFMQKLVAAVTGGTKSAS
jgi:tetratricopeptide (TPR) repeat protein